MGSIKQLTCRHNEVYLHFDESQSYLEQLFDHYICIDCGKIFTVDPGEMSIKEIADKTKIVITLVSILWLTTLIALGMGIHILLYITQIL